MPLVTPAPITGSTFRRTMDILIDKRVAPDGTLRSLLFPVSTERTLLEEFLQVDTKDGTWIMAPFNMKGQAPSMMAGHTGSSYMIQTPYINIERPLQHTSQLLARQPAGNVFTAGEGFKQAIAEALADDALILLNAIKSREEWMVANLIQGTIAYSQEGKDSFTIATGKPAGNEITAAVLWSNASAVPYTDLNEVYKIISSAAGPMPDIAICGSNAGEALLTLLETGKITAIQTTSGIDAGKAFLGSGIDTSRLQYIGNLGPAGAGVPFFIYRGTYVADTTETVTDLIRTDYIEFFNTADTTSKTFNYGRIPALYAEMENRAVTKLLVDIAEPTAKRDNYESIYKTRPLPWFYRPEWNVSLKVT